MEANCAKNAGNRTIRHNTVQDAFRDIARDVGVRTSFETRTSLSGARDRTDVTYHDIRVKAPPGASFLSSNKTLHIDVAVVEPASISGIRMGAHKLRGKYSSVKAKKKITHYASLVPSGDLFLPAVLTTRGFLDPDCRKVVALLAEHATLSTETASVMSAQDRDTLKGAYIDRFYTRISVALRKACSRCTSAGVNRISIPARLPITSRLITSAHPMIGAAGRSLRFA